MLSAFCLQVIMQCLLWHSSSLEPQEKIIQIHKLYLKIQDGGRRPSWKSYTIHRQGTICHWNYYNIGFPTNSRSQNSFMAIIFFILGTIKCKIQGNNKYIFTFLIQGIVCHRNCYNTCFPTHSRSPNSFMTLILNFWYT